MRPREEWREVRRRKVVVPPVRRWDMDDSVTSFYVANLPGDVLRNELWEPCAKLGNLVDVYIAGRRNAAGVFFAFVRFKDVVDSDKIERSLNEVAKVLPRKVSVPAPNRVPSASRDSRSFADVMKGKEVQRCVLELKLNCISEVNEWVCSAVLVVEAKSFDILSNFPSLLELDWFDVVESKYLGEVFKSNKGIWMRWFNWVDFVGKRSWCFERIAWLKIVRIPLPAWDDENFNLVACKFGKVLVSICSFWNSFDISQGKMCILTESRKRINEEVCVKFDGVTYKIGVMEIEDEWVPFKPFVYNSESNSEDEMEEEDGVTDTWEHAQMDLEDGETSPRVSGRNQCPPVPEDAIGNLKADFNAHASVGVEPSPQSPVNEDASFIKESPEAIALGGSQSVDCLEVGSSPSPTKVGFLNRILAPTQINWIVPGAQNFKLEIRQ
ncbi:hypothetical protein LXL04_038662 [Taraxacum kok-saghyz]